MTRRLAALALVAGCASQTPVATRHPEGELGARVVTGTASKPSPVSTPARVKERTASRSRVQTPAPVTERHHHHLDWAALRRCENSGSYRSKPTDRYRGAYQFDRQTWASVGGSGDPAAASPAEQDMRAQLLYAQRGRQPWPVCGRWL